MTAAISAILTKTLTSCVATVIDGSPEVERRSKKRLYRIGDSSGSVVPTSAKRNATTPKKRSKRKCEMKTRSTDLILAFGVCVDDILCYGRTIGLVLTATQSGQLILRAENQRHRVSTDRQLSDGRRTLRLRVWRTVVPYPSLLPYA